MYVIIICKKKQKTKKNKEYIKYAVKTNRFVNKQRFMNKHTKE